MTKKQARLRRLVPLNVARSDLPARTLFHAGPPYRAAAPKAVATAAEQAAVIGGLAEDTSTARRMFQSGELTLAAAQDHGIAVPLAMVLAPSMWCYEVGDDEHVFYAPMSEGPPPALRFGSDDPGCITRARDWCAEAAGVINPLLANVPDIDVIMGAALQQGDECHAVTAAGNALFVDALGPMPEKLKAALLGNAGFVLGIWMAWAGWKLRACNAGIGAIGGNGLEFGWRPHNQSVWRTTPAVPPVGKYFQPDRAANALGAIGDSAIVDICGFGGQALSSAPVLLQEWAHALPSDLQARRKRIVDPDSGIVDVAAIRATGVGPIINLAILDKDGAGSPIGRGFYVAPNTLFETGE